MVGDHMGILLAVTFVSFIFSSFQIFSYFFSIYHEYIHSHQHTFFFILISFFFIHYISACPIFISSSTRHPIFHQSNPFLLPYQAL
ncbi:hypothetical protein BDB01DRAFT_811898 [Pilobolus umbonatus]|nr:hypothetical protein BDB01DRAFT_811898 [Pilobolus umbonatus]